MLFLCSYSGTLLGRALAQCDNVAIRLLQQGVLHVNDSQAVIRLSQDNANQIIKIEGLRSESVLVSGVCTF
jgi:hypothetical protein